MLLMAEKARTGTRHMNLTKLTIAPQNASISLSIGRSGQKYDPKKVKRDEQHVSWLDRPMATAQTYLSQGRIVRGPAAVELPF